MIAAWVGQAVLGWLLADLASGLLHWWEDRVARVDMPVIGPAVIRANRVHHLDPLAFTLAPLWRRNAPLWLFACSLSLLWLLELGPSVVWAIATLGGLVAGEVHVAAHRPKDAPRWVQVLQETGLIQSPAQHAGHHRAPSHRRYCTLTNFLNPALDQLEVWSALERCLETLGLTPNRGAA